MLNLVSIYYQFGPNSLLNDYYGYVAHGLADSAQNLSGLADLLRGYRVYKSTIHFHRATFYNAAIGTPHEGYSQDLAIAILSSWLR